MDSGGGVGVLRAEHQFRIANLGYLRSFSMMSSLG